MRENAILQLSSGRYYQGRGVLNKLGDEAVLLGNKALIIADDTVWAKLESRVSATLERAGVAWVRFAFSGGCTADNYERAAAMGRCEGCELVVACGGGRAVDTGKIASDLMRVRAITVPTSLATCASTAWLSVHYREDSSMIGNYWTVYSPFCTLLDIDIAALDCPVRYAAAGILDAMAKYPEIMFNIRLGGRFQCNAFSETAALVARHIFDELLCHGESCMEKLRGNVADDEVEDCAALAVNVAGLTSVMACGGKQAAVCHLLYSWVCSHYPEIAKQFVHGEIVAASLYYQLALCDVDVALLERLGGFLHALGAPCCMTELGIPPQETDGMLEELFTQLPVTDKEVRARMRELSPLLIEKQAYASTPAL